MSRSSLQTYGAALPLQVAATQALYLGVSEPLGLSRFLQITRMWSRALGSNYEGSTSARSGLTCSLGC